MGKELPLREQINASDLWRLEDMYETNEAWEADFAKARAMLDAMPAIQGTLGKSAQALKAGLDEAYGAQYVCEKLFTFARMRRDEDNAGATAQAMTDRAGVLLTALSAAMSFVQPEILDIPEQSVREWMQEPDLAVYKRFIEETLLLRPYTLPKREEQLLAMAGDIAAGPSTIYDMLTDADLEYPDVPDGEGGTVKLSAGRYIPLLESRDPDVRLAAYNGMIGTYKKFSNTVAASYGSSVKGDVFYARARGYESPLHASLYPHEIPVSVYHSLVSAVRAHLPALVKYTRFRGKVLGLDKVRFCDMYVPLFEGFDIKLPFDEAFELCSGAMEALGAKYVDDFRKARSSRWIDVHETKGKTSGAYSWGMYGVHPYVLLNYQNSFDAVSTLAHEMGHALHSFYSFEKQPYPMADYPLFLAEVASTVNESLLLDELLRRYTDKDAQRFLLNYRLEQIRTTVIRQTMFAEFELATHDAAWAGEALTSDIFCALYKEIVGAYYSEVAMDDMIPAEWMRIPHFYRAFYVYQYATGFSAAAAIAARIAEKGESAASEYRNFLALGGSLPPLEALRVAGVDLSTPEPVEACLKLFEDTLAKLEALA